LYVPWIGELLTNHYIGDETNNFNIRFFEWYLTPKNELFTKKIIFDDVHFSFSFSEDEFFGIWNDI